MRDRSSNGGFTRRSRLYDPADGDAAGTPDGTVDVSDGADTPDATADVSDGADAPVATDTPDATDAPAGDGEAGGPETPAFTIPENPDFNRDFDAQAGADQILRYHREAEIIGDIGDGVTFLWKQWETDPVSGRTFASNTPYSGPNENKTVINYTLRETGNEAPAVGTEDAVNGVNNIPWSDNESWNRTLRLATESLSDVANIEFVETENADDAQIVFQHYAQAELNGVSSTGSGFAGAPGIDELNDGRKYVTARVTVNMNVLRQPNQDERINGWRNLVLTHEIGHALSLPHTGDYDLSQLNEENVPILHRIIAGSRQDTGQYSMMAYPGGEFSGADFGNEWSNPLSPEVVGEINQPSTPMLHDVLALQQLYGANPETRKDNTVYGFNSTAGRDHFDFDLLESEGSKPILTIYDAGGNDTIDLSGYDDANLVNLYDGNFSNVGGLKGNVAIAYDTVIENAVGGTNDDVMVGNDVDNHLQGGAGSDLIFGHEGSDWIEGGSGDDTLYGDGYDFTDEQRSALDTALGGELSASNPSEAWQSLIADNPVIADIWDRQRRVAFNNLASEKFIETRDNGYVELVGAQYRSPEEALADSANRETVLVDSVEERNALIQSLEEDWSKVSITLLEEQRQLIDKLAPTPDVVASAEGNSDIQLASAGDYGSGGGGDHDVAVFQGARDEYTISGDAETGAVTVSDSVSDRDGTDQLRGFEQIAFADTSVATSDVATQSVSIDGMAKQLEAFASASGGGVGADGLAPQRSDPADYRDNGILAA